MALLQSDCNWAVWRSDWGRIWGRGKGNCVFSLPPPTPPPPRGQLVLGKAADSFFGSCLFCSAPSIAASGFVFFLGRGGTRQTHNYLAAGPGKLCLLLSLCLFRKRKKNQTGRRCLRRSNQRREREEKKQIRMKQPNRSEISEGILIEGFIRQCLQTSDLWFLISGPQCCLGR